MCKDANSVCSNGICHCNSGYRNIDGGCREGILVFVNMIMYYVIAHFKMLLMSLTSKIDYILNNQFCFCYRWFA